MEHGRGDKYVAGHPAHCSLLVWGLCFVRYFMSSQVKLDAKHKSQHGGFGNSKKSCLCRWISPSSMPSVCYLHLSWRSVCFRMSVPLPIFGRYTNYIRKASDIVKANPVRMPFVEKASMAVVWDPHNFVDCIRNGSICDIVHRSLLLANFIPSQYSRRILGAAGGSSQTSEI